MSTSELKEKAKALFLQGMSPEEIHLEINEERSLSTVYNWIKDFKKELELENEKSPYMSVSTEESNPALNEPSKTTTEASKKLSKPYSQTVEPPTMEEIKLLELEFQQSNAAIEVKRKKRHAVRILNGVLGSLLVFSQKKSWDESKASEYLEKLREVQELSEGVCQYDSELYEKNLYWIEATSLIGKLEKIRRDKKLKKEISKVGIFSLEEKIRFEEIMELSNFEATGNILKNIRFTSKFKALLINDILSNDDKDLNLEELQSILLNLNHVLQFATENELQSEFTSEINVLEMLKLQFEELYEKAEESWIFKSEVFELDSDLKLQIEEMLENSGYTPITDEYSDED
ncbi:helix-turn-helix domain-containing protein [Reichenbachiella sp. MALMAid0571]|uniref:helix-turn-helix domain-containing protein n=1 Tax=Reichenbachiella sp. MALMAid0571 TaxID=3143939 RepID=UPI0032DFB0EA